jgi:hypothetical protein
MGPLKNYANVPVKNCVFEEIRGFLDGSLRVNGPEFGF